MELVTKSVAAGSSFLGMTSRTCPRCGRNDIRRSGRHTIVDRVLGCVGLVPYRCRACRNRFFGFLTSDGDEGRPPADVPPPSHWVTPIRAVPMVDQPPSSWPLAEHPLSPIPVARSLLIVSRDPAIRKLLCKLLAQPGYYTHQLTDSAELPAELQARKVDVLITDLDLPEQQALETVAALRSQYPNLKIIALSGLRVSEVPGSIVLPKPFRRELLLESVQNALVDSVDPSQSATGTHGWMRWGSI